MPDWALEQKEEYKVVFKRFTVEHLSAKMKVCPESQRLSIDGVEVALVYYRYLYSPSQYNEMAWEVREKLEVSRAIKCPDVFSQLVGMKYY